MTSMTNAGVNYYADFKNKIDEITYRLKATLVVNEMAGDSAFIKTLSHLDPNQVKESGIDDVFAKSEIALSLANHDSTLPEVYRQRLGAKLDGIHVEQDLYQAGYAKSFIRSPEFQSMLEHVKVMKLYQETFDRDDHNLITHLSNDRAGLRIDYYNAMHRLKDDIKKFLPEGKKIERDTVQSMLSKAWTKAGQLGRHPSLQPSMTIAAGIAGLYLYNSVLPLQQTNLFQDTIEALYLGQLVTSIPIAANKLTGNAIAESLNELSCGALNKTIDATESLVRRVFDTEAKQNILSGIKVGVPLVVTGLIAGRSIGIAAANYWNATTDTLNLASHSIAASGTMKNIIENASNLELVKALSGAGLIAVNAALTATSNWSFIQDAKQLKSSLASTGVLRVREALNLNEIREPNGPPSMDYLGDMQPRVHHVSFNTNAAVLQKILQSNAKTHPNKGVSHDAVVPGPG